jgi:sec-independent protein translocase protein TatA
MIGGWELIAIAAVVVVLFGVNKIPKLGGAIGESIRNFKKGIKDIDSESSDKKIENGANEHKDS